MISASVAEFKINAFALECWRRRTARMVTYHWATIRRVAEELETRKRSLNPEELDALLGVA
jgi:hypothetical protein